VLRYIWVSNRLVRFRSQYGNKIVVDLQRISKLYRFRFLDTSLYIARRTLSYLYNVILIIQ